MARVAAAGTQDGAFREFLPQALDRTLDVDAVGPGRADQVMAGVEQEGDLALLADRRQDPRDGAIGVIVGIGEVELETGDVGGVEGRGQDIGKGRRLQCRRREKVEAAGRRLRFLAGQRGQPLP